MDLSRNAILDTLLLAAPVGFAFFDRDLRYVFVNERLAEMHGIPAKAHPGRHVSDIVPDLERKVVEVTRRIVETRAPVLNEEFFGATPSTRGEKRWWNESWYPVSAADGTLIGFGAVAEDITARKQVEENLREAVARHAQQVRLFDSIASTTPDFVYLFDPAGRFLYANHRLLQVWGMKLQDIVGKSCRELGYEQWHHDMHMREIAQVIETRQSIKGEVPFKAPLTGIYGVYEYIFTPVFGPDGAVELIAGTTRDVTERKSAEHALREADERKNEFLATLAHELRNPLAPLRNGLTIARLSIDGETPLRRTIEMMDRQLNHLVRLVDDLLNIGRITSGKIELRRDRVHLRNILASSIELSRASIDSAGHELVVDEGPEPLVVDGDFYRLSQVFSNLLNNAAKYSDRGGRIMVNVRRGGNDVIVEVRDTGIGIPAEDLPHVFDLFSQVHAHHDRGDGGLGIGLAVVKKVVEMHGGQVSAASAGLGKGSSFAVRLPLITPDDANTGNAGGAR